MNGGRELEGGGHAGVGVAATFDGEHAGAGGGRGEPEGEGGEGDVVGSRDGGERRGRLGEVVDDLVGECVARCEEGGWSCRIGDHASKIRAGRRDARGVRAENGVSLTDVCQ